MAGLLQRLSQKIVVKTVREIGHKLFSKYLLLTNTAIGFSLAATGDVINQRYEKLSGFRKEWNPVRTRNQCVQGMVFGSVYHYWYIFLDRVLPGYSVRVVVRKVLLDQLIMAPIGIVVFFVLLGTLEGQEQSSIVQEIKDKGQLLLAAEWTLGPVSQLVNFFFLPTRFRVLYDSLVCLSFDAYYTCIKYRHEKNSSVDEVLNDCISDDVCLKIDDLTMNLMMI